MANVRVKEQFIGSSTEVKGIGRIVIEQKYAEILFANGRTELLEGIEPPKRLEPVAPKALEELTKEELREKAKGLDGYNGKLTKAELIELINANPIA